MSNVEIIRPSRAQASLELELLGIEAEEVETGALYARLRGLELPREVAIRLESLSEVSRMIGDKILAVGKIIVLKLLEFVEQHPNMAVGMALGAAVSVLVSSIPWVGQLLTPVSLALGVAIGGIAGHRLDKGKDIVNDSVVVIAQDALEIARHFFAFLIQLFRAVTNELTAEK
jgi:hypothetical protein